MSPEGVMEGSPEGDIEGSSEWISWGLSRGSLMRKLQKDFHVLSTCISLEDVF